MLAFLFPISFHQIIYNFACVPSQNGAFFDCLQPHNATFFFSVNSNRLGTKPSVLWVCKSQNGSLVLCPHAHHKCDPASRSRMYGPFCLTFCSAIIVELDVLYIKLKFNYNSRSSIHELYLDTSQ